MHVICKKRIQNNTTLNKHTWTGVNCTCDNVIGVSCATVSEFCGCEDTVDRDVCPPVVNNPDVVVSCVLVFRTATWTSNDCYRGPCHKRIPLTHKLLEEKMRVSEKIEERFLCKIIAATRKILNVHWKLSHRMHKEPWRKCRYTMHACMGEVPKMPK